MKQEDIEKAAHLHSEEFSTDAYKSGSIGSFIAGSNWRINSVWHYDKSAPMINKPFLLVFHKGAIVLQIKSEEDWNILIKDRIYVKWAYVEDLIPNKE